METKSNRIFELLIVMIVFFVVSFTYFLIKIFRLTLSFK